MFTAREAQENERYKRKQAYKDAEVFVDKLRTGETVSCPRSPGPGASFWDGVNVALKRYGLACETTARQTKDLEVTYGDGDIPTYVCRLKRTLGRKELEAEVAKLQARLAEIEELLNEG